MTTHLAQDDIIIENQSLRLVVSSDCMAKSLICKANGEECLMEGVEMPLFSVTQERPFNNENKLANPCKRTTYPANKLRREGDKLIVGFQTAPYEAVVKISEKPQYVAFSLEDFVVRPKGYGSLKMDTPPVAEFCLLQLPVRDRSNFGEWLNVNWDANTAVNVLAAAPQTLIDAQKCDGYHVMHADVCSDIRLKGPGAVLIVDASEKLMDSIAAVEEDFDLPKGVENRRNPYVNASIYWVEDLNLENLEEHIRCAKAGGFRMMLVYYTSMFLEENIYGLLGDYTYRPEYPNGRKDLIELVNRIKESGLIPGLHFLQTHIGFLSRYVTPVADHRLHLTRHFTLSKPLGLTDTTVYVEQDTINTVLADGCRVLQFGGELITYAGYTQEAPFCFTGCVRGAYNTTVQEHPLGQIGGILDVSEFCAVSVYLDQDSSLADEIADKLADAYNCGFQFVYFDGSEGTNKPYAYHIPNAQYRVFKKMQPQPMLAEGAAKSHFSWHMLSGGNAFDIFRPAVFKEKIGEHPAQEAPIMRKDFTRVNFGWWRFWGAETQPDMFEYGTSRAAAWDCPITLQSNICSFKKSPRFDDTFEVLRRWEEVRATNWLTQAQKEELKKLDQEHILLINEKREFELVPYNQIQGAAGGNPDIIAFSFTRNEKSYVVYWHKNGSATLKLPVDGNELTLVEELWEQPMPLTLLEKGMVALPADKRRYLSSNLPVEVLIQAFQNATVEI